jgi:tripartite-type tricarboxylate transporter receptor subunit TctC
MKRLLIFLLWVPVLALAQGYPSRALRMIVPFAPGGASDFVGRILQPRMSELLGQQVVVENRGGAAGNIGVEAGARSAPDGYTFVLGNIGSIAINPAVFANLSVTPTRDLIAVTQVVDVPSVLVAHPSFAPNSIKEVIDYARAHPGKLNYASPGSGSQNRLEMEVLRKLAGLDMVHVPYKGAAPAVNDLVGGQVQMGIFDVPVLLGHIRSGKLKALSVTSATRAPTLPNVPTTAEGGYPNVTSDNWYGLVVPAATPAEIQKRLSAAAVAALRAPALAEQYARVGGLASPGSPEDYARFLAGEQAKWSKVVNAIGFKE